jgi:hypothetical protein
MAMSDLAFRMYVGYGPWRIDPQCPGLLHNTMRAAEGRNGQPKCICPRGRAMLAHKTARTANRQREMRTEARRNAQRSLSRLITRLQIRTDMPVPNFTAANCREGKALSPERLKVVDGGYSSEGNLRHKQMCEACPIRLQCLEWALATREPEGIWGGATAADRSRILTARGMKPLRRVNGADAERSEETSEETEAMA